MFPPSHRRRKQPADKQSATERLTEVRRSFLFLSAPGEKRQSEAGEPSASDWFPDPRSELSPLSSCAPSIGTRQICSERAAFFLSGGSCLKAAYVLSRRRTEKDGVLRRLYPGRSGIHPLWRGPCSIRGCLGEHKKVSACPSGKRGTRSRNTGPCKCF